MGRARPLGAPSSLGCRPARAKPLLYLAATVSASLHSTSMNRLCSREMEAQQEAPGHQSKMLCDER